MTLTQRQRRLLEKEADRLMPRLSDYFKSEANRCRWATKADLRRDLQLPTQGPGPDALDVALRRMVSPEDIRTRRKGLRREIHYAWFPWRQLRLPLGVPDSALWPSPPRPNHKKAGSD